MTMHMVITGNPVDGFTYVGPFQSYDEALSWAERVEQGADWWLGELEDPEEQEHNTSFKK